jgi:hypothetical protein
MKMAIENCWNDSDRGKGKYLKKILLQYHAVHHRSHMNRPTLHNNRPTTIRLSHGMATH